MANEDLVVNRVHSASTATPGRSISRVRDRELVIDEPTHLGGPGEEFTPPTRSSPGCRPAACCWSRAAPAKRRSG